MNTDVQRILYADENGDLEGIFEAQLIDPVPTERANAVRTLLAGEDAVAHFHAILLLVAWGDHSGLAEAERMLAVDEHPFAGIDTHRLYGVDISYDRLADALSLAVTRDRLPIDRVRALAERLLDLSRTKFFQNGLEQLISALNDPTLTDLTEQAITELARAGDARKASDLLPALATMDPLRATAAIDLFRDNGSFIERTDLGVARAFARIHTPESRRELERFLDNEQFPGARSVAKRAIDRWDM